MATGKVEIMKVCTRCEDPQSLDQFSPQRGKPRSWCKSCCSKATTAYKMANYSEVLEENRRYSEANPNWVMLNRAKDRSKKKNVPFSLTKKDIVIPEVCPILGIPLFRSKGLPCDNSPSIDEIIPGLGYTPENSQIISYKANSMKSNATVEELKAFAKWVRDTYGT